MRTNYIALAVLAGCQSLPPEPVLDEATQYIGEDRDTGDPWYPDTEGDGDDGDDGWDNDGASQCKDVTITGSVFYNDLRSTGRFLDRYSPTDVGGVQDAWGGDNINYLGLRDAVIDFYEVDDTTAGEGCAQTTFVGGATINDHGDYSFTAHVCDPCDADHDGASDNGVSVAGRIRLRFCNSDRCFSVRDSLGMTTADAHFEDTFVADPYRRWLRGASLTTPRTFMNSTPVAVGNDYFQASASQTPGVATDLYAQAASVFASLVDTTRVLHYTHDVPYDKDRFGEVQVFYPSVLGDDDGGGAHSHQPENKGTSRLCIESQMNAQWIDPPPIMVGGLVFDPPRYLADNYDPRHPQAWFEGSVVAHEYGHLVHYWQWDGYGKWTSLCYDDPACEEGGAPEYVLAALKEGWADFIRKVVWNGISTGSGCDNIDTRSPSGSPYTTPPAALSKIGRRWFPDVEQALCDLWDGTADNATYGTSAFYDTVSVPLAELVAHLGLLWDLSPLHWPNIILATSFDGDDGTITATAPVGICEFVNTRANNAAWITALMVNGIDCRP